MTAVAHPQHSTSGTPQLPEDRELTLSGILSSALRHRRRVVGIAATAAVLVAAHLFVSAPSFLTTASFTPGGSGVSASQLSGLAAQFGFNVPSAGSSLPAELYESLLRSNWFLRRIALEQYRVRDDDTTLTGTFVQLYEIEEDTPEESLDAAIEMLSEDVLTVSVGTSSGVVSAVVDTKWPDLSEQIGQAILKEVDAFTTELRRTQAEAETKFMNARVDAARVELRNAEDALQAFVQRNRDYVQNPLLHLQHDRLQREVTMRQEVYTGVSSAYEQARLEAERSTPAISVIEPAPRPLVAEKKGIALRAVFAAFFIGALVAALFAFVDFRSNRTPVFGTEEEELRMLWADTRRDLRRIIRFGRA